MVKYGPKIWNFLPCHVKTSENLKTFKNIIKNWNSSTCNCKVCQSGAELILSLKFFLPVQHLLILCTSHIKKVRHIRSKGKKVRKARDYVKSLGTSGTQGTKAHETRNLAPSYILCVYVCVYTIFPRVSTRGAYLILNSQRGALIQWRRSFEGNAH